MTEENNVPIRVKYLDLMEKAFDAYTLEQIRGRKSADGLRELDLHAYSRLTTVLSCLLHGGRRLHLLSLWKQMMTECCHEIVQPRPDDMADFAIKEMMFSLFIMKDASLLGDVELHQWDRLLIQLDPYVNYRNVAKDEASKKKLHNINIYNMIGEFLREQWGLTDTKDYFAEHWPAQIQHFDTETGMYRDPGCPMLYDITTRCHVQMLLEFGYKGPYANQLDHLLRLGGNVTLYAQSAAYEFPYGGRSSQFLFNEALIAANAEYEAKRFFSYGDHVRARKFKRAASLAVESVVRWLDMEPPRHLKNRFPIESKHGTEPYGYYDKYMITFGAFIGMAYWFAQEDIEEYACPAETGGYVWRAPDDFHMIIANAGGYSVQIDSLANLAYDATGLGRLHRAGFPTELALSTPLSAGEYYEINSDLGRVHATMGPGWSLPEGEVFYFSRCTDLKASLHIEKESKERVRFTVTYHGNTLRGCRAVVEYYELSAGGLIYSYSLVDAEVSGYFIQVPLLESNGEQHTVIQQHEGSIEVTLDSYRYRVEADCAIVLSANLYGNRNGAYRLAALQYQVPRPSLKLELSRV
ncbi:hypothetical protein SY83_02555 [Paenibacillus swuensis]|uniref:Uncharacterized protein n=1 Tax=Paenibacillus swuensis TaxID=1178515 RepID=A0A172TEB8_9BACL|nr:hypothetical protein [Paenibacillus swuensis]ANE45388.1 hypothetical protein SY83_02555 [Paenibacillus swuensis]